MVTANSVVYKYLLLSPRYILEQTVQMCIIDIN